MRVDVLPRSEPMTDLFLSFFLRRLSLSGATKEPTVDEKCEPTLIGADASRVGLNISSLDAQEGIYLWFACGVA